jgi:adenine C2-methylase RlmN of 23S rRNA A2503 and tRNA A37
VNRDRLCRRLRAEAQARLGKHAEAAEEAASLSKGKRPADQLFEVARVYALCVDSARQDKDISAAERDQLANQYGTRAVRLLSQANAAGFFDTRPGADRLRNDEAFKSILMRKDYQKLLKQLKN